MSITYAWAADITKSERDEHGDLVVYGKATGPDLDLDGQVCDPAWLKGAMPKWFEWGNVREMHQPIAAGIGVELDADGADGWWLKSKVIDAGTAEKIEKGVLKGYSIGIKDPKIIRDAMAPGGRIVGGHVVEVSYVDRPCNPTSKMAICKAAGGDKSAELAPVERPEDAGPFLGKRDYSKDRRAELAAAGHAMPDGSFPVEDRADLQDAVQAIGRAKDPSAVKTYLKRRARELGAEDAIPDSWKVTQADAGKILARVRRLVPELATKAAPAQDIASAQAAIAAIARLIAEEAQGLAAGNSDEACQISTLLQAVAALEWFICQERSEAYNDAMDLDLGGSTAVEGELVELAASSMITKSSGAPAPAQVDDVDAKIAAAVQEANKAAEGRINALAAQLAKALAAPVPGGPVLARPTSTLANADKRASALAEAQRLETLASQLQSSGDHVAADSYRKMAADTRATLAA